MRASLGPWTDEVTTVSPWEQVATPSAPEVDAAVGIESAKCRSSLGRRKSVLRPVDTIDKEERGNNQVRNGAGEPELGWWQKIDLRR